MAEGAAAEPPVWTHSREVKVVAITGGTHGNEVNGVALARHLLRHPQLARRPSFETTVVFSNPAAIEANVRYVEEDLNRCFLRRDLADPTRRTAEATRAKEINALLGPKGAADPNADLVIDLHNTTANSGVALMMPPQDELSHAIGAFLSTRDPTVRVVNFTAGKEDYPMLPTIGRHGMTFEVGAVAWGCIDGALFQQSLTLLMHALDYVHAHNLAVHAGESKAWQRTLLPVYEAVRTVDYPRYDENVSRCPGAQALIAATIHPSIRGKDFVPIRQGDPVFLTMEGEEVGYDGGDDGETNYPFFIDEAAYYEKGIAFMIAHRTEQAVRVVTNVEASEHTSKRLVRPQA